MPRPFSILTAILALLATPALSASPLSRLERIQQRGFLGCGVEPTVQGFAEVDAAGRYKGFDIDICRAVAAAVLGQADKVRFVPAPAISEFLRRDDIDVVSRRLTWELRREAPLGVMFGPVTFHDGQGFLVAKSLGATAARDLSATSVCVAGGTVFESQLNDFLGSNPRGLKKTVLESPHAYDAIARALTSGSCRVYTGDLSDLGAIRTKLAKPNDFVLLPDVISKEPLAPLVRADDPAFFAVLRWTVFALIAAEELGVTPANIDTMRTSANTDVRRLIGVIPGNGKALGLSEAWAYNAIKSVGNYGEIFERNLGPSTPRGFVRGLNRLSKDGGLMYAPPLR